MNFPTPPLPTDYDRLLKRIDSIDPIRYGKSRNFIDGAVTYLSPYISRGIISTRQVYQAMLAKGYKLYQIEKFASELAWRDYFQQVYRAIGSRLFTDIKQPQQRVAHQQLPLALQQASTGIEAIDAGIQHLYHTGYMHNHLRMYTASLACNIGRAHWLQPARWLYYHLLDADLASNHCSWQWVAGAFSSKLYFANQENINKYTGSRQLGSYLDTSYDLLPELPVPAEWQASTRFEPATPLPASDALPALLPGQPVFLYHHYNLDPTWRTDEDGLRILLLEPSHFQQHPLGQRPMDFILHWARRIDGLRVYTGEVAELAAALQTSTAQLNKQAIYREHPAFGHWPGQADARPWLVPEVQGYFPSFFAYWKKVQQRL